MVKPTIYPVALVAIMSDKTSQVIYDLRADGKPLSVISKMTPPSTKTSKPLHATRWPIKNPSQGVSALVLAALYTANKGKDPRDMKTLMLLTEKYKTETGKATNKSNVSTALTRLVSSGYVGVGGHNVSQYRQYVLTNKGRNYTEKFLVNT